MNEKLLRYLLEQQLLTAEQADELAGGRVGVVDPDAPPEYPVDAK